jgi:hypothetical protein
LAGDEPAGDVEIEVRLEWAGVDNISQRKLCVTSETASAEQRKDPVAAPKSCYVLANFLDVAATSLPRIAGSGVGSG